jgi:hypothetical protein
VSPKRGDRVPPPPAPGEWDLIFGTSEAAKSWDDLVVQAPANTLEAWRMMRTDPTPNPWTSRQHPLKGSLATGTHGGRELPQWQIEVTGGGRIWYLVDVDARKIFVMYASTRHPKATD